MVSGTPLFVALFNNLAIFIALVAVYGAMVGNFAENRDHTRQLVIGFAFGLFAVGCMNAKIPVYEGVIVDQRNAVVALSGAFGGPWAALVSAILAGSYRTHLGGMGVLSGVTGIGLAALAGAGLHLTMGRPNSVRRAALAALIATVIILPGFLLVGTFSTGFRLMLAMTLPYGTAIFLGIFLVGLLLGREDRRHQAEQRFRQMVATAPEAIIVVDRMRRIRLFNAKAESYSGLVAEQVIGRPLSEQTWLDPTALSDLEERLTCAQRNGANSEVLEIVLANGEHFFAVSIAAIFSTGGEPEWVVNLRDVTARRRADEARADFEARILQSKSLEALGRLAGGVAHDFNNMLTVILGTVDLLRAEHAGDEPLDNDLRNIGEAASKAAELTAQLLAFGRKQVLEPQVLKPNEVIRGLVPLLRRSIPENIELNVICADDVANVLVDVARLEQVIVNLVVNARDAMSQGGRLTIGTSNRELDEAYAAGHPEVIPGKYVEITVSDTGVGMNEEVRARIFEPFFTTKGQNKGTGLGLATVHGIVRQSGGHVYVYSEPGAGTCFRVYLPQSMAVASAAALEPVPSQSVFSGHVLLAEDSDLVRGPIKRMLMALGFRVTEARSGKEALAAFLAATDPIDLVLTDVVMRDVGGRELASAIMARDTSVRVLFMSGYTENAIVHQGVLDPDVSFISKPFTIKSLRAAIAQSLMRTSKKPPKA